MRVAVAGGTGVVGRRVVTALTSAGHQVVVLARANGIDLVSGAGLASALDGVRAVIDVSNVVTTRRQQAVEFFSTVTRQLMAAGELAGVQHHLALSIVGIDRVPTGYYQGKLAQEHLVLHGPVPGSVLRATQFHEFAGQLLDRMPGPVAVLPRMPLQPVAAGEVAAMLAGLGTGTVTGRHPELAGPQVHELAELARRLLQARGERRRVLPVPLPGATGRALAAGALLPQGPGLRGQQTFEQWLAELAGPERAR
jgi:uncharacterized protein YbjT (DUF2867 family)